VMNFSTKFGVRGALGLDWIWRMVGWLDGWMERRLELLGIPLHYFKWMNVLTTVPSGGVFFGMRIEMYRRICLSKFLDLYGPDIHSLEMRSDFLNDQSSILRYFIQYFKKIS